ncbi:hypothetical protein [Variovorax sp. EL159]|uniref:hypothetical protein n=1 Tax=Variovorax sp. EL159 TaxID=1566270 RepID=UPI00088EECC7|nr:hypothetical protein [Variovorax sp. EL159]SCX68184.1 hypothetical protein SAMN03159363_3185 [Variovorax sp. EL159]
MTEAHLGFLIVCLVVGVLGAVLGAWAYSHSRQAELEAQSHAFELAREKANRDWQQALLCVPQWIQQNIRLELEIVVRQQAERWKEQLREQQRWQSEQDELRQAEWRALLSGSPQRPGKAPVPVVATAPKRSAPMPERAFVPRPIPAPPPSHSPEPSETPRPQPVPVYMTQVPERELSDEEIDALPPDLPTPNRLSGRKLPAPKGPVLRNI